MFVEMARAALRRPYSIPIPPPAPTPKPPEYLLGLDLGQAQDYSALCIIERTVLPERGPTGRELRSYAVRHLHRWHLGTPYTTIVQDVADLAKKPPLPGAEMAVDATGVGRPVVDLFRKAGLGLRLTPVIITSGLKAAASGGFWHAPKRDLVAVMQTLVQAERFAIAPSLSLAEVLGTELLQFRVKVSATTGNETFEAWRERDHDDLVLAVALACWLGERGQRLAIFC
jgi:hypothetical protein